ncbi:uncharacterized protein LOC62_02G003300 [Vanrija pseudolonga]|uniref:Uncharacterized protein n=1 Tax=Vanrija pseudolonga TaxID=143232 RepID=A0AAF1BKM4_9TREE|nr:hypothetical protein LOC62_02G003300 [Vanrija pseudolonga]
MSVQTEWEAAMDEYDTSLGVAYEAEHVLERALRDWNLAVVALRQAAFDAPEVEDAAFAQVRVRGAAKDAAKAALEEAVVARNWRYELLQAAEAARDTEQVQWQADVAASESSGAGG